MKINEHSNKSYPSMVAHPQIIEYTTIMLHIIHSFENDTSLLLNLLRVLLLKWLICANDYLTFYNNMERKENLGDI